MIDYQKAFDNKWNAVAAKETELNLARLHVVSYAGSFANQSQGYNEWLIDYYRKEIRDRIAECTRLEHEKNALVIADYLTFAEPEQLALEVR